MQLCEEFIEVADSRLDFQGLDSILATQTLRQLKLDGQSQKDSIKFALNAALGGVWHEARANSVYDVGDMCVRCGEAVEDLEHIVHHCPAWAAERSEVALPASALEALPCVKLHGLLPAPKKQVLLTHEPALASRLGVHTVRTDGSGRHSAGLKQSVYRAEFLAVVRALEECKPKRLVSGCKGVVSCLHALRAGRRQPKGRHRDLESRALAALPDGVQIVWMKAHQSDRDAEEGRVEPADLQGNRMADAAVNR
eukprot:3623533-Amphidinium_carterae.1